MWLIVNRKMHPSLSSVSLSVHKNSHLENQFRSDNLHTERHSHQNRSHHSVVHSKALDLAVDGILGSEVNLRRDNNMDDANDANVHLVTPQQRAHLLYHFHYDCLPIAVVIVPKELLTVSMGLELIDVVTMTLSMMTTVLSVVWVIEPSILMWLKSLLMDALLSSLWSLMLLIS